MLWETVQFGESVKFMFHATYRERGNIWTFVYFKPQYKKDWSRFTNVEQCNGIIIHTHTILYIR